MKELYCVKCCRVHSSPWGWSYKKYLVNDKIVEGWGCSNKPIKHEWTTDAIKEDRKKFDEDIVQPFHPNTKELNKKFVKIYPRQTEAMLKDGSITEKEYRKAKV